MVQDANNSNDDLALVKFSSSQEYETVPISTVPLKTEILTFAGGYASEMGTLVTKAGKIAQYPDQSLKEGYRIGFTSDIEQGMSGGPILDAKEGELIGINGQGAYPILNTLYVYQDGTTPSQVEIETMRQLSWGIPINTFLAQVNSDILTAYKLPLPQTTTGIEIAYTGWIGELEEKAKQITVRIDSSSGANGSGVIIAKEGNTYTVLTAAHVVCEREDFTQPCQDETYQILAPDGQTYPVDSSTIKRQEGVDLAVVRFTSQENFPVAQLANYPVENDDAVFVAGYPKLNRNQPAPWLFSLGYVFDREQGLFRVNDSSLSPDSSGLTPGLTQSQWSLAGGYEMVYTSITYGGMSGGAVLDREGRVIGIHGLAEGETTVDSQTSSSKQIQLGNSLGIPINTFIGLADRLQVNSTLPIQDNKPRQLNSAETQAFQDAVLGVEIPQGNATAEIWLERGNQLFRLRRYDEAVEAFERAIALKPEFIHLAYYGKGLALWGENVALWGENENDEAALASLELATETQPDFAPAFLYKTMVLFNLRRLEQALVAIERAIEIEENNANLYVFQAAILSSFELSEIALSQAIEIAPRSFYYYERAEFYRDQGKPELALADYNQVIQLNPNDAEAYYIRGELYENQGKPELALANYNQLIQLNPNDAEAYFHRAKFYRDQGKPELALADYNQVIQLDPQDATAYISRGSLYQDQGKLDLALAEYNQAIQIFSNWAFNRALEIDPNLALAFFNRALEIDPNLALAYAGLGVVNLQQGDIPAARTNFQQAQQLSIAQGNMALAQQMANVLQQLLKKSP